MGEVPGRRNGFSRPYTPAQVCAWIALFSTFAQFLLFISPILPLYVSIPLTLYFVALVMCVIVFGGLTQAIDPMDVHLRKHLNNRRPEAEAKLPPFYKRINPLRGEDLPDEVMKQCWLCDAQVAEHSMHCKFCNKCVNTFDHHCIWLNTCVGKPNYIYFYRTILSIFVMQFSHIVIQVYLVVDIFLGGETKAYADSWFNANAAVAVTAVLILFIFFDCVSIFLIGQLLHFHIGLQREKLTTYQYIVRDHQRKRERSRLEGELMSQRARAIAKAKREGNSWEAFRLKLGGSCRSLGCTPCDPLELPKPARESTTTPQPTPETPIRAGAFADSLGGTEPEVSTGTVTVVPLGNGTTPDVHNRTSDDSDEEGNNAYQSTMQFSSADFSSPQNGDISSAQATNGGSTTFVPVAPAPGADEDDDDSIADNSSAVKHEEDSPPAKTDEEQTLKEAPTAPISSDENDPRPLA